MHLNTLSLGVLLLGTALAAPPKGAGSKGGNPAPPKGGGGRAPPLPGSIAEGKLPIRPAAVGQASTSKASAKQIKIGDVFEVISGKKKDSCDQYYDAKAAPGKSEKLLNQYWDQVYTFTVAGQQAAGEKYEASAEKRKLVQSFFGILPAEKGKLPMLGLEAEAMDKVDDWHNQVLSYITTARTGKDKPILACGSTALKFQKSYDEFKDAQGQGVKKPLSMTLKQNDRDYNDLWVWWNENTKEYLTTERTAYQKEELGNGPDVIPFEEQEDGNSEFCTGQPFAMGITFAAAPVVPNPSTFHKRQQDRQSVVILCPRSFKLQVPDIYPPMLRHSLDKKAHAVGTELADMGTNALTLYHEMYHLVIDTGVPDRRVPLTPDMTGVGAKKNPEGKAYVGFPAEKKWFSERSKLALGPIKCMYLALFDRATPRATNIDQLDMIRHPETYAWFGLASALHDVDKMDWSSGKAAAAGSPYKGVWTSNADHVSDPHVPFDTTGEDPDCPDQGAGGVIQIGGTNVVALGDSSDSGNEEYPGESSSEPESVETDSGE